MEMAISLGDLAPILIPIGPLIFFIALSLKPVSYTHLRAHETLRYLGIRGVR